MLTFIITAVAVFALYLLLTAGSAIPGSTVFLWSREEILAGIILSIVAGLIGRNVLFREKNYRMLNPKRWFLFIVYLVGPFFFAMAKANFDVAYRVLTGKINPGIVKISPKLSTDLGITLLADSITLTPGTLSVDVNEETNDLYVHWINVKKPVKIENVCGSFPEWARRIAE
ncbi:MAG: Na+/H+ antiporter subunit E [Thermoplasmatales archaeon]|nr:Na+/H+ antiporter subunit E [Thermoplasmatales archaeon]